MVNVDYQQTERREPLLAIDDELPESSSIMMMDETGTETGGAAEWFGKGATCEARLHRDNGIITCTLFPINR
jgi:hypothetical protein